MELKHAKVKAYLTYERFSILRIVLCQGGSVTRNFGINRVHKGQITNVKKNGRGKGRGLKRQFRVRFMVVT